MTSHPSSSPRAHLALASVSDYIRRPPSPTSAAVDWNRVGHLRRRFRLAVAAAYRDTSSGKWAHVSELARLGCTIGRWQGVCSGSKAPHSLCPPGAGDRNDQVGDPQPEVNPYPRPPVPVFDPHEIRERVENWQANVVSAPPSSQDPHSNLPRTEDAERLSPLNFPTVKRRKSDVAKAMKRKRMASSERDRTTSRYFRGDGLADRMSPEPQAVDRDAGCVTPTPRSAPCRSNAELTPHSRAECPDEDPEIVRRLSPTPPAAPVPENIHQIAEAFLPPSFPSQLRTSTPPPARDRLIKPPVIPRAEGLFFSPSLPSFLPFPRSQPDRETEPPALHTRFRQDIPSPADSPSARSKRRLQATTMASAPSSSEPPHGDAGRRGDLDARLSPAPAPVIDLHQLALTSSQRSRDSLRRHPTRAFAFASSPVTPRTAHRPKGKGKARAMTAGLAVSPRGAATRSSRSLSSPPLFAPPHAHAQTQTPPLSPLPDFTRDAHAFAPAAASTQQQQQQPSHASAAGSQREISGLEARVFGLEERDVAAWVRDAPVVEADADARVGMDVEDA